MTFTEFKKKYKINTNFPCYIGLCNAIPKHWRKAFSGDNENDLVVTEHESGKPFKAGFTDQTIAALYVSFLCFSLK